MLMDYTHERPRHVWSLTGPMPNKALATEEFRQAG